MELYIKNTGVKLNIGQPVTYEDTKKMINDYISDRNIVSHYQRIYKESPNTLIIDFGSYIDVIILEGNDMEIKEVLKYLKL